MLRNTCTAHTVTLHALRTLDSGSIVTQLLNYRKLTNLAI